MNHRSFEEALGGGCCEEPPFLGYEVVGLLGQGVSCVCSHERPLARPLSLTSRLRTVALSPLLRSSAGGEAAHSGATSSA